MIIFCLFLFPDESADGAGSSCHHLPSDLPEEDTQPHTISSGQADQLDPRFDQRVTCWDGKMTSCRRLLHTGQGGSISPGITRRWPNVVLMLGQRQRRFHNMRPTLGQCLVCDGWPRYHSRFLMIEMIGACKRSRVDYTEHNSNPLPARILIIIYRTLCS